jgi:hypothetical protein
VTIVRSGGFAGMIVQRTVDTSQLSLSETKKLNELLARSAFENLPHVITSKGISVDRYEYEITVVHDDTCKTVQFAEDAASSGLRELADFVLNEARTDGDTRQKKSKSR